MSCFTSGIIPHSARPPSTNQSHARLTFVAKVSVDEFVGRQKAFKEEMKHFAGVLDTRMRLNSMEQGKGNTIIRIINVNSLDNVLFFLTYHSDERRETEFLCKKTPEFHWLQAAMAYEP